MPNPSTLVFGDGLVAREVPGPGDKVLWVHGYTLDSSIWEPLWAGLPHWHHLGVDLPGHGLSGPPRPGEPLAGMALRIGQSAIAQGVRHIVGLSLGARVVLHVACAFPKAFASLTLGSPSLGGGPQDPHIPVRFRELTSLYRERGRGPWLADLWVQSPPDIFKGAASRPELWADLRRVIDRHGWSEFDCETPFVDSDEVQNSALLGQISARTLLFVGEEDMPAFLRCASIIHRSIPSCKRTYLPKVGHLAMLEALPRTRELISDHLLACAAN
jgi:pimeloyl-ACP methyl ester carboxylesterase